MLWHLDRGWARHLEEMNDVRESIHLRALGRENPLDEFHRIAIDHFRDLASDAVRESESTFAEVEFTPTGVDLDANGMARRPRRGPTWSMTTRWPRAATSSLG